MKFPSGIPVYGDRSYRGFSPTELEEHVTLFAEIRRLWPHTLGKLALHPRNEGKRNWRQIAREKAEGMAAGAVDLIIPGHTALVLELKRRDHTKSRLTDAERDYLIIARDHGAHACIALGWEAGITAVEEWAAGLTP